jgi:ATP-dependent Clp protease ATP-binding subunit ClpC
VFERFTDRARRVVVLAHEESTSLAHPHIGTEHILLGLSAEGESVAAQVLTAQGISADAVRTRVEQAVPAGEQGLAKHIPFTPGAKKTLELSLQAALDLGHHNIGPEHILLGLIRDPDRTGTKILVSLGADLDRVREGVFSLLERAETGPPGGSPGGTISMSAFRVQTTEIKRLRGEVRRLRALLHRHGIEPDEPEQQEKPEKSEKPAEGAEVGEDEKPPPA